MKKSSKKNSIEKLLLNSESIKQIAEKLQTNVAYIYKVKKQIDKNKIIHEPTQEQPHNIPG